MLAGAVLGAAAINGLHAQGRPPAAFVIIDVGDITDPDGFAKQTHSAEAATLVPFGGQFVMRTNKIVGIEGAPPKQFVVVSFTSAQAAKDWASSAARKEFDATRVNSTKSREFIVDGMIQ